MANRDSDNLGKILGKSLDRVDGRLKVTGAARYSADFLRDETAYGALVLSSIASGRIINIDLTIAESQPGVLSVITHQNAPQLHKLDETSKDSSRAGEPELVPLQTDAVHYNSQILGIVIAETLEQAQYAASLIKVTYNEKPSRIELKKEIQRSYQPKLFFGQELQIKRGSQVKDNDLEKIDCVYSTPIEHHNPMEPHATLAYWEDDRLTVHTSTQWTQGTRNALAHMLGIEREKVHLLSLFVGGGFGSKGFFWAHPILAAVAAKTVKRPVKLVYTRQQMFTANGHRANTIQNLQLSAARDGKLVYVKHETTTHTSMVGEFVEPCGMTTPILYACPNVEVVHNAVRLNLGTPTSMRAPGEATGSFALESAMDELAHELGIDPIELRTRNYAEIHPQKNIPWSSKHLRECYAVGAEIFNWQKRRSEPRSVQNGQYLIGYGMASAAYPANRANASATTQILANGNVVVSCATQDIGTGTYTVMAMVAADALRVPIEKVEAKLGDSSLAQAPISGGSRTTASISAAVRESALATQRKIIELACADWRSPLYHQSMERISSQNGRLFLANDSTKGETFDDILKRHNLPSIEGEATAKIAETKKEKSVLPTKSKTISPYHEKDIGSAESQTSAQNYDQDSYAFESFGAQFAEVRVDQELGMTEVTRFVSVMDVGQIINEKTARSQVYGGILFGIGMALMEETKVAPVSGRVVTRDLADYLVPVCADTPEIQVVFLNKPDNHINSLGCRGVGEIGITGTAAAIANAIFNATGKRVRDLPITPDKLL